MGLCRDGSIMGVARPGTLRLLRLFLEEHGTCCDHFVFFGEQGKFGFVFCFVFCFFDAGVDTVALAGQDFTV